MAASSELPSPARAEPGAKRTVRIALAVAALAVLGLALVVGITRLRRDSGDQHLRQARQLVADEGNFDTATDSGVTFTQISRALEQAGDSCRPQGSAACNNLFAAAGYARVSAVGVLRCTRPGVYDARASMQRLVDDLQKRQATARIPAVVRCR